MSVIKPFKAIRPAKGWAAQVSSHAVERYSPPDIQNILDNNPCSFLQVIYAGRNRNINYPEQLKSIKSKFEDFIEQEIFEKENESCLYIYRQVKDGRSHLGVIALASVDEYTKGKIKIHEQTLAEREEKLKEYLTVCDFNAEPVCLTHPFSKELDALLKAETHKAPLYDFSSDNIHHGVWKISSPEEINAFQQVFANMACLYIADGHHRAASSALLAEQKRQDNPAHTGEEPYNYFMAAFFAETELSIFNFDRMVSSLNGHTPQSFLKETARYFNITPDGEKVTKPASSSEISLYLDKGWYMLRLKEKYLNPGDPVNRLDVSMLSNLILGPILNITNLRDDKRITFVPGVKGIEEIQKAVDIGKTKAAFCLYPVSFAELIAVADAGKEMPPKSTWVEPKLESGLLVYSLNSN